MFNSKITNNSMRLKYARRFCYYKPATQKAHWQDKYKVFIETIKNNYARNKTGGAFVFVLIFLVLFLSRKKVHKKNCTLVRIHMTTLYILLAIIIVLLIILTIKLFTSNANDAISNIASIQNEKLNTIAAETTRIEESVKKEISLNRIETNNQSLRARQELAASLQSFEEKLNHLT
jgi:hypothetical protein